MASLANRESNRISHNSPHNIFDEPPNGKQIFGRALELTNREKNPVERSRLRCHCARLHTVEEHPNSDQYSALSLEKLDAPELCANRVGTVSELCHRTMPIARLPPAVACSLNFSGLFVNIGKHLVPVLRLTFNRSQRLAALV